MLFFELLNMESLMENITNENLSSPSSNYTPQEIFTPKYIYIWITLVNAIIFLTGCIGNILVIVVVVKVRDMRTPTNYCLVNLSVTDLLVLTICQTSAMLEFYAEDRWLLGEFVCRLIPFLEALVTHASILILMRISIGRYYAVCRPLQSYSTYSRSRTMIVMSILWTMAGLSAVPFIVITNTEQAVFHRDGSNVTVCRTHIYLLWHYVFLMLNFWVFFVIPFLILVFIYSRIIHSIVAEKKQKELKNDNAQRHSSTSRKQLVSMMIAIVILFFICVLPMRIVVLWFTFTDSKEIEKFGFEYYVNLLWFARVMLYLNSAGNPIIYNLFSGRFRMAFSKILGINKSPVSLRSSQKTLTSGARYSFVKYEKSALRYKEDKC